MPKAHVTVQPTGQAIATTSGHSLARRSRPRKTSPHCSSPTTTPGPPPPPPPPRAPPSPPDTTPSTDPTSTSANNPPSGKPRKVSIHHRKNRHPAALGSALSLTTIAPHPHNLL